MLDSEEIAYHIANPGEILDELDSTIALVPTVQEFEDRCKAVDNQELLEMKAGIEQILETKEAFPGMLENLSKKGEKIDPEVKKAVSSQSNELGKRIEELAAAVKEFPQIIAAAIAERSSS